MKIRFWLRLALIAGVGVVLIGFGVICYQLISSRRTQIIVLPGGERFEYLGMASSAAEFSTEPPWRKKLRRILPKGLADKLPEGFTEQVNYGNTNGAVIYYTLTDAAGANVLSHPWQWIVAVADDGFVFPVNGGGGSRTIGTRVYNHVDLQAFPRRQKNFELRFLDGNNEVLGSLRVENPILGPFPTWTPETLPIFRTNDGMVVKLERLSENGKGIYKWANIKWKVIASEPKWAKAKPIYQTFEDATGNHGGLLATNEPAWKLTLPFHRSGWTNFADGEKFRLADLPVPEIGGFVLIRTNFDCGGATFRLNAICDAGELTVSNETHFSFKPGQRNSGWSSSWDWKTRLENLASAQPFLLIDSTPIAADADVRFRLIGSDGREIKVQNSGWGGRNGGGRRYQQKFDLTNDVATITLEVIVSRPRVFEFLVNPAEVQRNTNTNK